MTTPTLDQHKLKHYKKAWPEYQGIEREIFAQLHKNLGFNPKHKIGALTRSRLDDASRKLEHHEPARSHAHARKRVVRDVSGWLKMRLDADEFLEALREIQTDVFNRGQADVSQAIDMLVVEKAPGSADVDACAIVDSSLGAIAGMAALGGPEGEAAAAAITVFQATLQIGDQLDAPPQPGGADPNALWYAAFNLRELLDQAEAKAANEFDTVQGTIHANYGLLRHFGRMPVPPNKGEIENALAEGLKRQIFRALLPTRGKLIGIADTDHLVLQPKNATPVEIAGMAHNLVQMARTMQIASKTPVANEPVLTRLLARQWVRFDLHRDGAAAWIPFNWYLATDKGEISPTEMNVMLDLFQPDGDDDPVQRHARVELFGLVKHVELFIREPKTGDEPKAVDGFNGVFDATLWNTAIDKNKHDGITVSILGPMVDGTMDPNKVVDFVQKALAGTWTDPS